MVAGSCTCDRTARLNSLKPVFPRGSLTPKSAALPAGLTEWGGAAAGARVLAPLVGVADREEFFQLTNRLHAALTALRSLQRKHGIGERIQAFINLSPDTDTVAGYGQSAAPCRSTNQLEPRQRPDDPYLTPIALGHHGISVDMEDVDVAEVDLPGRIREVVVTPPHPFDPRDAVEDENPSGVAIILAG